jgi:hypothetical protein
MLMTAPTPAPWPYRSALILAASALLLAIVSMMFDSWVGTALMIGAIAAGVLSALGLYQAWGRRSRVG